MEKMAAQISKMVSSREKTTFQFSNTVFSWKKWLPNFQKWFCREKKTPFIFQTRFFHGKKAKRNLLPTHGVMASTS